MTVHVVDPYRALVLVLVVVLVPVQEVHVEEGIRYLEVFQRLAILALLVAVASSCWSDWAQARIQVEGYLPSLLAWVRLLQSQGQDQVPFHDWVQSLARVPIPVQVLVPVLLPCPGVGH